MIENLRITFNPILAHLLIREINLVRYTIRILSDDEATVTQDTFDVDELQCIGSKTETYNKYELCNRHHSEMVIWVARGLWGIPLRYRHVIERKQ